MGEALLTPSFPFESLLRKLHLQKKLRGVPERSPCLEVGLDRGRTIASGAASAPRPPAPRAATLRDCGENRGTGLGHPAGDWVLARRLR